ncbi:MAG TPA: glycosyltransferase family 4 protein [Thermoanaerobaculia bacterium]|nr:glycosyltransferase family 4 protein [Thermoanaerobaculia bacterium]
MSVRPRIDFVSPLPPVRSGIADYSADLLPHLAAVADLRLIALPGQDAVAGDWAVAPASELGAGGRLPLYQMGNNRHHEAVLELALRQPGVLTLHDLVLHHLLLDVTMGRNRFFAYKERLARDHGWVGEAAALAKRWGAYGAAPLFALPAHRTLLRRQRGVLVHSAWAAGLVEEDDPEVRVRAVPMGVPLPPPVDPAAARELRARFGLPAEGPVVGSFGFQTPIKRTAAAIHALAAPGLERVHMLIVGEVAPALDLESEARRLGVADRLHITGFLSFADFAAAIAAVDLCVNLRYPTAGETSASLLRVMAAGRPVIVSDYAQFAELPEAVAVKVPLGRDEAAALPAALRELLSSPERLRAMGEAARRHVAARHAPERAAAAVGEACAEWAEAEPPGDAPSGAQLAVAAPGSIVWGRLDGEIEVAGAELPWPEGERRQLTIRLRNRGFARWDRGERGPGGIAVVVKLLAGGRDLLAGRPWLPLPRDLLPGEEIALTTEVRRPAGPPSPPRAPGTPRLPVPPGAIRLWIEPHMFGGVALSELGGPRWERDL